MVSRSLSFFICKMGEMVTGLTTVQRQGRTERSGAGRCRFWAQSGAAAFSLELVSSSAHWERAFLSSDPSPVMVGASQHERSPCR